MHDHRHRWPANTREAIALQKRLSKAVITTDAFTRIRRVAGVDVGFEQDNSVTKAAVVIMALPHLNVLDQVLVKRPTSFPYVPGLLSFREAPAILDAFEHLHCTPDLILCDGQGFAHPRRFGLACHLGVRLDLPAIGVAKSRLIGTHEDVPPYKGAYRLLYDGTECIGAVLRTRANVRPLYISIGHRISLESAIEYVMRCTTRYRLPETTRAADKLASGKA